MAPTPPSKFKKPIVLWLLVFSTAFSPIFLSSRPSFQQQPGQTAQSTNGGKTPIVGRDSRKLAPMRVLALFSGTSNDLGLDHRIGRQVLKLAANRAKQLHPELSELELIIINDDTECTSLNTIPNKVAEHFYSDLGEAECTAPASQQAQHSGGGAGRTENGTGCGRQVDVDLEQLDLYLQDQERDLDGFSSTGETARADSASSIQVGSGSGSKVDAILGPSCDFLVDLVGRMAAYWLTPIYSVASISGSFARKDIYSTLTRLSPSIDHLSMFIVRTMEKFSWRHLAIIVDEGQIESSLLLENLERTINHWRYQVPIVSNRFSFDSRRELSSSHAGDNITRTEDQDEDSSPQSSTSKSCNVISRETLLGARKVARVFLFLINDQQVVRWLLLCASELHMNNGEFTFLAVNLGLQSAKVKQSNSADYGSQLKESSIVLTSGSNSSNSESQQGPTPAGEAAQKHSKFLGQRTTQNFDWYSAEDEANNLLARQMFESLMVFSVDLPTSEEYSVFIEQTLDLAQQEFPLAKFERAGVGAVAAALHDSLLLAVEAYVRHSNRPPQSLQEQATKNNESVHVDSGQGDIADEKDRQVLAARVPLMWNEHFSGGLISGMHINSNGDQELDYVLSDLEPEMGLIRPVASYSKETRKIELLANSYIHWPKRVNSLTRQTLDQDEPPPDEPECGFNDDAEQCVDRQNLYAALAIIAIILALVLVSTSLSLYKYRRIKYQMQLDDYWWRVNWHELHFVQYKDSLVSGVASAARAVRSGGGSVVSAGGSDGASSFVSIVRASKNQASNQFGGKQSIRLASDRSNANESITKSSSRLATTVRDKRSVAVPRIVTTNETGGGESATPHSEAPQSTFGGSNCLIRSEFSSVVRASNLAMYKDELVIVKQLNGRSLEVSRDLLVELKSMRDHLNENLAKFIGLCVEPEHLSIVYEFCSRGSLQDMLLNQAVAMDWTLKYSIIGDILSGLNFIHTTLLDFHGRLKSTNLVLDSRFTVKITDFGLQNLYSQLEPIKDCDNDNFDDDDSSEDDGDAAAARKRIQHDQKSLTVSQAAYNMESVSVVGSKRRSRIANSSAGSIGIGHKACLKNRGAARYFWTAPEHLRDKNAHCAGSKKGDVYSFAIILSEIFTRKEPYYYGTTAKPNWNAIKSERRAYQQLHTSDSVGDGGGKRRSVGGAGARTTPLGSEIGGSTTAINAAGRQTHRSRMQHKQLRLKGNNSVGPVGGGIGVADMIAEVASIVSISGQSQASSKAIEADSAAQAGNVVAEMMGKEAELAAAADQSCATEGAGSLIAESVGLRQSSTTTTLAQAADKAARLDAEEILDQLRMGVQPEPVRPYQPNYVLQDVNKNLLELMRSCWAESPAARPTLGQVRISMRRITKGMASKNYLDNLLDRLQNYAADLERIVDGKSADIMNEKFRTEELLFQLVPKFVADRLKRNEPIIPQVFDGATIFFSDIVGFEKYASVMSPGELVDLLNNIYSSFESIISSFDVTKIETIIDQFLVASGISIQQEESPVGRLVEQPSANNKQQSTDQQPGGLRSALSADVVEDASAGAGNKRYQKLSRKNKLLGSLRISHGSSDCTKGSFDSSNLEPAACGNSPSNAVKPAGGDRAPMAEANESSDIVAGASPLAAARANGLEHYRRSSAEQIARMALCIRDLVRSFHFRQSLGHSSEGRANADDGPKTQLSQQQQQAEGTSGGQLRSLVATSFNIRIGIHSGKVCAGIVGVKRPKFCLIGDTVNVASRMHTNSKANRIQISGDTKQLLEHVPGFTIEPRGKIEVKGKGMMETFWLESSY